MGGDGIADRPSQTRRSARRDRALATLMGSAALLAAASASAEEPRGDETGGAEEPPDEDEPPARDESDAAPARAGFTLEDDWDRLWIRLFARTGKPDPDGPLLQRFHEPMGPRYQLDMHTQSYPMSSEKRWAQQATGARLWVRSLDEMDLANRLELRTEIETWEDGYVRMQYDQMQDWTTDQRFLRFEVGHRDIAGAGVDAALRAYPRFEKNDSDIEAIVRYRRPGVGQARLRVGALDPFINATFTVVRGAEEAPDEFVWQLDPPLAVSLDLRTERVAGVRAEVYGGAVVPQQRRHRFPDAPEDDHLRRREALLGGGLVEWAAARFPLAIGASALGVRAQMDWEYLERADDLSVGETTVSARAYALSRPLDTLRAEGWVGRTTRPETRSGTLTIDSERADREWLWSLRVLWMPARVGLDVQYLGNHRRVEGPPFLPLGGTGNRLGTRMMLMLGSDFWTSFGTAWALDSESGPYDRAGMTLIYAPQ